MTVCLYVHYRTICLKKNLGGYTHSTCSKPSISSGSCSLQAPNTDMSLRVPSCMFVFHCISVHSPVGLEPRPTHLFLHTDPEKPSPLHDCHPLPSASPTPHQRQGQPGTEAATHLGHLRGCVDQVPDVAI